MLSVTPFSQHPFVLHPRAGGAGQPVPPGISLWSILLVPAVSMATGAVQPLPLGSSPSAALTSESKGSLGRSHQVTLQHNGPTQQLCALIYASTAICWTGQSPSLHARRNRQLHSPLHSRPAKERANKNKEAVMPSCPFLECPWGGGENILK